MLLTVPRQKQIPVRIDDDAPNHHFSTTEERFCKQYYEVHDLITNELERRYEQESFQILQEIEDLVIKSCSGTVIQPSEKLKKLYSEDIYKLRQLKGTITNATRSGAYCE